MRPRLALLLFESTASVALALLAGCGPGPDGSGPDGSGLFGVSRPNAQGIPTRAEARTALIYEANLHQRSEEHTSELQSQ